MNSTNTNNKRTHSNKKQDELNENFTHNNILLNNTENTNRILNSSNKKQNTEVNYESQKISFKTNEKEKNDISSFNDELKKEIKEDQFIKENILKTPVKKDTEKQAILKKNLNLREEDQNSVSFFGSENNTEGSQITPITTTNKYFSANCHENIFKILEKKTDEIREKKKNENLRINALIKEQYHQKGKLKF